MKNIPPQKPNKNLSPRTQTIIENTGISLGALGGFTVVLAGAINYGIPPVITLPSPIIGGWVGFVLSREFIANRNNEPSPSLVNSKKIISLAGTLSASVLNQIGTRISQTLGKKA